ncbi:MAG: acyl carrier protein [Selenomonadaceae bacterium]|nr:acyl carrier protein [Selenomonadaceae bacterium]
MKNINAIILEQIESFNENLDTPVDTSKGDNTILFGAGGVLDSVDFVGLILDIEQTINDEYGKHLALTGERVMSQRNSPFRTVGTLAAYIEKQLED